MPTLKKKVNFLESEEGAEIEQALKSMSSDESYNTESSYSTNTDLYPDNLIPFVDKHMKYLSVHPNTDPQQYISNLRMMTRVRR